MRGKVYPGLSLRQVSGITPAYAGKRSGRFPAGLRRWDHPRVCGEKWHRRARPVVSLGSPPRVRGKVQQQYDNIQKERITPAYAGKSGELCNGEFCIRDHPRVCGEKDKAAEKAQHLRGSPPPARGKVSAALKNGLGPRITPACAGKRPCGSSSHRLCRDHPRVCGEKTTTRSIHSRGTGSPPRMRGKENRVLGGILHVRITPAYAGKSSIQHLTASLGEFEVQKGHPVPHLRQRLQVWPDHARHLRHGLILHASRSAGQGRRLCPGPYPDTAGSGTPRGPSPAKRPHRSPPAATPGGCRAWQSGATAPGSR